MLWRVRSKAALRLRRSRGSRPLSTDPAHEVAGHSRGVPAVEPPAVPDRRDAGEAGTSGRVDVYSTEFLWTARRTGVHDGRNWSMFRFHLAQIVDGGTIQHAHAQLLSSVQRASTPVGLLYALRGAHAIVEPAHILAALSRCAALAQRAGAGGLARETAATLLGHLEAGGTFRRDQLSARDALRALWCLASCEGRPGPGEARPVRVALDFLQSRLDLVPLPDRVDLAAAGGSLGVAHPVLDRCREDALDTSPRELARMSLDELRARGNGTDGVEGGQRGAPDAVETYWRTTLVTVVGELAERGELSGAGLSAFLTKLAEEARMRDTKGAESAAPASEDHAAMGGPRPLDLSTGAALVRACVGVWGLEGVLPGEAWRAMADLLPVKLRLRPKATFWEGGSGTGAGGHVNWGPPASAEESRSVQRHLSDLEAWAAGAEAHPGSPPASHAVQALMDAAPGLHIAWAARAMASCRSVLSWDTRGALSYPSHDSAPGTTAAADPASVEALCAALGGVLLSRARLRVDPRDMTHALEALGGWPGGEAVIGHPTFQACLAASVRDASGDPGGPPWPKLAPLLEAAARARACGPAVLEALAPAAERLALRVGVVMAGGAPGAGGWAPGRSLGLTLGSEALTRDVAAVAAAGWSAEHASRQQAVAGWLRGQAALAEWGEADRAAERGSGEPGWVFGHASASGAGSWEGLGGLCRLGDEELQERLAVALRGAKDHPWELGRGLEDGDGASEQGSPWRRDSSSGRSWPGALGKGHGVREGVARVLGQVHGMLSLMGPGSLRAVVDALTSALPRASAGQGPAWGTAPLAKPRHGAGHASTRAMKGAGSGPLSESLNAWDRQWRATLGMRVRERSVGEDPVPRALAEAWGGVRDEEKGVARAMRDRWALGREASAWAAGCEREKQGAAGPGVAQMGSSGEVQKGPGAPQAPPFLALAAEALLAMGDVVALSRQPMADARAGAELLERVARGGWASDGASEVGPDAAGTTDKSGAGRARPPSFARAFSAAMWGAMEAHLGPLTSPDGAFSMPSRARDAREESATPGASVQPYGNDRAWGGRPGYQALSDAAAAALALSRAGFPPPAETLRVLSGSALAASMARTDAGVTEAEGGGGAALCRSLSELTQGLAALGCLNEPVSTALRLAAGEVLAEEAPHPDLWSSVPGARHAADATARPSVRPPGPPFYLEQDLLWVRSPGRERVVALTLTPAAFWLCASGPLDFLRSSDPRAARAVAQAVVGAPLDELRSRTAAVAAGVLMSLQGRSPLARLAAQSDVYEQATVAAAFHARDAAARGGSAPPWVTPWVNAMVGEMLQRYHGVLRGGSEGEEVTVSDARLLTEAGLRMARAAAHYGVVTGAPWEVSADLATTTALTAAQLALGRASSTPTDPEQCLDAASLALSLETLALSRAPIPLALRPLLPKAMATVAQSHLSPRAQAWGLYHLARRAAATPAEFQGCLAKLLVALGAHRKAAAAGHTGDAAGGSGGSAGEGEGAEGAQSEGSAEGGSGGEGGTGVGVGKQPGTQAQVQGDGAWRVRVFRQLGVSGAFALWRAFQFARLRCELEGAALPDWMTESVAAVNAAVAEGAQRGAVRGRGPLGMMELRGDASEGDESSEGAGEERRGQLGLSRDAASDRGPQESEGPVGEGGAEGVQAETESVPAAEALSKVRGGRRAHDGPALRRELAGYLPVGMWGHARQAALVVRRALVAGVMPDADTDAKAWREESAWDGDGEGDDGGVEKGSRDRGAMLELFGEYAGASDASAEEAAQGAGEGCDDPPTYGVALRALNALTVHIANVYLWQPQSRWLQSQRSGGGAGEQAPPGAEGADATPGDLGAGLGPGLPVGLVPPSEPYAMTVPDRWGQLCAVYLLRTLSQPAFRREHGDPALLPRLARAVAAVALIPPGEIPGLTFELDAPMQAVSTGLARCALLAAESLAAEDPWFGGARRVVAPLPEAGNLIAGALLSPVHASLLPSVRGALLRAGRVLSDPRAVSRMDVAVRINTLRFLSRLVALRLPEARDMYRSVMASAPEGTPDPLASSEVGDAEGVGLSRMARGGFSGGRDESSRAHAGGQWWWRQ